MGYNPPPPPGRGVFCCAKGQNILFVLSTKLKLHSIFLGILHELLKQNPKHVVMVDIDEIVVSAATKYLRGICYDSMDQLVGDNYEVLHKQN